MRLNPHKPGAHGVRRCNIPLARAMRPTTHDLLVELVAGTVPLRPSDWHFLTSFMIPLAIAQAKSRSRGTFTGEATKQVVLYIPKV